MIATGKLKVSLFLPSILIVIGLCSIMVIKFACLGKMSNFPLELIDEIDKALLSNITALGVTMRNFNVSSAIRNLSDLK